MIFKEEDLGKYISKSLSSILIGYTSHPERRGIAEKHDVSDSIVRDVANRRVKLTAYSLEATKEVVELALKNADKEAKRAAKARRFIKDLKNKM